MTRRPGLSLPEVLTALFIMAIGAVSILVLFPLGALNMGQALKDDRTAQAATQADAFFRYYWRDQYDNGGLQSEPFYKAMNNPNDGTLPGKTAAEGGGIVGVSKGANQPSYPVLVDPMGVVARTGTPQRWCGDNGFGNSTDQTSLPRWSTNVIQANANNKLLALRNCSLLDGLSYDQNTGAPATTGVERDMRYNWMWLLQRRNNRDQDMAEMVVAVFDKRAHLFAPIGTEAVFIPSAVGTTSLTFPAGIAGKVQKGGWILDCTVTTVDYLGNAYVPGNPNPVPVPPAGQPAPRPGVRNGNFYRVVSVTENGANMDVELQTPLKAHSGDATGLQVGHMRFAVFAGLAEVFERDTLLPREPAQ